MFDAMSKQEQQKPTGLDFLPDEPAGKRILDAASEIIDARNPIEFREAIRAMASVLAHFGYHRDGDWPAYVMYRGGGLIKRGETGD